MSHRIAHKNGHTEVFACNNTEFPGGFLRILRSSWKDPDGESQAHEQDKGLKTFFASPENQSAIFNWCYEGYKRLKSESLTDPDAVISANKEYEEESDRIGQFVDAWLEEGEAYEVRTSAAYRLYGEWCDKYGYRKENSTNFNNAIQRFFRIQRKRPKGETGSQTTMLIGCRFLDHENGEADENNSEFGVLN